MSIASCLANAQPRPRPNKVASAHAASSVVVPVQASHVSPVSDVRAVQHDKDADRSQPAKRKPGRPRRAPLPQDRATGPIVGEGSV
jgi:hypothetical protein